MSRKLFIEGEKAINGILAKSSGLFKALGHPTRLRIVEMLSAGERCVCEILPAICAEQSTVSKHLAVLRKEGVVWCRKEGLKVIYGLSSEKIVDLLEVARAVLEEGWERERQLWEALKEG